MPARRFGPIANVLTEVLGVGAGVSLIYVVVVVAALHV